MAKTEEQLVKPATLRPLTRSRKRPQRTPLLHRKPVVEIVFHLNRLIRWDRFPPWIGVFWLAAYREALRARNLLDTDTIPAHDAARPSQPTPRVLQYRTADGSYNDLSDPTMGMAGTRFGRNFPLEKVYPDTGDALLDPSPRDISRELLTRETFQPATTLNLLAAAWIQFQVHDWFNHGESVHGDDFEIPLTDDDPWHENPMRIPPTKSVDPTRYPNGDDGPPTFINPTSMWWDGSVIYGSNETVTDSLRTREDGKLVVKNRRLPVDPVKGIAITGFNDNWWIGLGLLHTLFTLEHNAICDQLRLEKPSWSDDQLFNTARLINAALMAKIHTVEWTPAILENRTIQLGMRINWWGLAGERAYRLFGRLSSSDSISGIPGSAAEHHTAPYALTEEFVAVYRMHPLIPEDIAFHSLSTGEHVKTLSIPDVSFEHAEEVIDGDLSVQDVFYSFGICHPGAIQLHNYPRHFQDLKIPDGRRMDLGAVDIMRDRERGVPRYNEFRRLLGMPTPKTFAELTPNPRWAKEIREIYNGDIERVDVMVGMFAEEPPKGIGFSDTALRIFALMASRRLKSDRFFTDDFTPEVYTPTGMKWIADNNMISVLLRHYPELTPAMRGVKNAFAPWQRIW